jgi:transposase
MYRDVVQWAKIRHCILVEGVSRRQMVRETGISRKTIRKMLAHPQPPPYGSGSPRYPKLGPHTASVQRMLRENATLPPTARLSVRAMYERLRDQEGFRGSYGAVKNYVRPIARDDGCIWEYAYDLLVSLDKKRAIDFLFCLSRADSPVISPAQTEQFFHRFGRVTITPPRTDRREQARRAAFDWMRALLQKDISDETLRREVGDLPELAPLLQRLYEGRLSHRNRSMAVLATHRGLGKSVVCPFLGIDEKTYRRYLRLFEQGGAAALFGRETKSTRKADDETVKKAVFSLLHEPPSNYGINRTSWKMADFCRVLREKGRPICPQVVRKITQAAGYRWRRARVVLTSHDPVFSEKLDRIRTILSGLGPDEAFFSIDEFGPFAVRTTPGRTLTAPGEQRVVPQWQKSRGCLIVTAALELSGNQLTHFYSIKKNTVEMIRMMELLVERYGDRRKLYLSWDAASWHISNRLYERIEEHNAAVLGHGPTVDTAPLPSGAQFLNVIESVFSGMARAIIHNSDYQSLDEAKTAIDRYFDERNVHYSLHPRRAGHKIWRKEREPAAFCQANNCKDPYYYR